MKLLYMLCVIHHHGMQRFLLALIGYSQVRFLKLLQVVSIFLLGALWLEGRKIFYYPLNWRWESLFCLSLMRKIYKIIWMREVLRYRETVSRWWIWRISQMKMIFWKRNNWWKMSRENKMRKMRIKRKSKLLVKMK